MATAVWLAPVISRNGASSRGGGPPTTRSHTRCPIPTVQWNAAPSAPMRTFLTRSEVAASVDRTLASESGPSPTRRTRKAAAAVSVAVTSWGSGGGTARSVAWVTPPERSDPVATVGP